jgi:hypothetical protein
LKFFALKKRLSLKKFGFTESAEKNILHFAYCIGNCFAVVLKIQLPYFKAKFTRMCSQKLDTSFLRTKFATIPVGPSYFFKKDKIYPSILLEPDEPKQAKNGGGGGGGRARRAVFPGGQDPAPEKEQNRKPHKAQVQPGPSQVLPHYFLKLDFLRSTKYEIPYGSFCSFLCFGIDGNLVRTFFA